MTHFPAWFLFSKVRNKGSCTGEGHSGCCAESRCSPLGYQTVVNFEKYCRFRWEHLGDWRNLCTETVLGKETVDPEREGILTKVPPTLLSLTTWKTPRNFLEMELLSGWGPWTSYLVFMEDEHCWETVICCVGTQLSIRRPPRKQPQENPQNKLTKTPF